MYKKEGVNTFFGANSYIIPYSSPILYQNKVILKNAGEAIRLHNQHGILVDSIYFDGTSHKTKPNRLSADNADGIAGDSCISLQRKYVTYNSYGSPITDNLHWETQHVRLGTIVPIIQPYITSDFYWEQGSTVSSGSNYIIRVNPIDECSSVSFGENGNVSIPHGCRAQITITHFNEHGQSVQTTHKSASPTGEDIVLYTEYNRNARTIRNWLPIATDGVNQLSLEEVQSFATTQYNDTAPYTTTHKELSRRARTKSSITAGETYQNHAVRLEYDINNQVVPRFIVTDNGFMVQGEYPIGSLRGTIAIDADGKKQSTFVDMDGRTIVTRLGDDLDTYYVYDDLGRLCYVLPPAITSQINNSSSFSNEDELIRNYAYVYKYDKRGNQIYKRLPGAEHTYMVYDKAGHLVLQQDGNQRERGNIWLMTKYDAYGRNIYSLECDMQEWDYSSLLDTISDIQFTEHYSATSTTSMLGSTGYTNTRLVMPNSKVLVVNYYDDYDFLNLLPEEKASMLRYENKQGYGQQYENATGLATGTISYNLSDEQYTIATNYYDVYGNIIQARNTSLGGGYHVAYTAYNLDGTKSKLLLQHHTNQVPTQAEKYAYSYDHVGRPTQTIYQLNDEPSILHTQMHYDQQGQVIQMLRHNAQDSTHYQYNTQGALTKLSNAHFSEHLFYADSLPNYATPYYNGNISATSVYLGDSAYHFAYDYDDYNRLVESFHCRGGVLHTNEYFEFDVMGNLKRLQRYSLQNRILDDLVFALEGNRIKEITDYASAADLYDTKEYYDRATATDMPDMQYDANGNLTRDLDRTIDTIRYNMYNLPDTVVFANGNKIINHYNASGNKWKTEYHTIIDAMYLPNTADGTVFEGNVVDIHYTIYDGNIEYKYIVNSMGADSLYEYVIHNTEGYIAYHPQNNTMTHYYYHQDHLGNICAVWDATHDSIVQQTLYYASGLPVSISTGQDVQPYKYNGKEFVEMHGYDVYEYGARGYYATIGRFTSIDPLCEQTPWQSPYVYANNNWVNNIDWMGMSTDVYTSVDPKQIAKLLAFLSEGNSLDDYDFDGEGWDVMEDWTFDESEGKLNIYVNHISGEIVPGLGGYIIPDVDVMVLSYYIEDLRKEYQLDETDITSIIGLTNDIIGNYRCNDLYWIGKNGKLYFWYMVHKRGGYAYSRKVVEKSMKPLINTTTKISRRIAILSIAIEGVDIFVSREITGANAANIVLAGISLGLSFVSGVGPAIAVATIGVITAADLIVGWTTDSSLSDRIDKPIVKW